MKPVSLAGGVILMLALWFVTAGVGNVERADQPDYAEQYSQIIAKASMRLQEAAKRRPLKIKAMNDSLEKTALAAREMAGHGNPDSIRSLLKEAQQDYEKNSFAILLEGILVNAGPNKNEANRLFENFLKQSRTFSEFEEPFLKWGEFHFLRRIVYEILNSRGIDFKGRETEIRVRVPYESLIMYAMTPSRWDMVWNLTFLAVLIFGGAALIFAALDGVSFFERLPAALLGLYVAFWVSYGTWLFDLAFGLPYGLSRQILVPAFLGTVSALVLPGVAIKYWQDYRRPLEKGFRRCPHCRSVISELLIECLECRKKIEV